MLIARLAFWFLLTWLSNAADVVEDGIQAELEANQLDSSPNNNCTALGLFTFV